MYMFMFLICFVIGIITTYRLKDTIIEDCEDFFPFMFIVIAKEGYRDADDVLRFAASSFVYLFLLAIVSLLWFIAIPLLLIYLLIKVCLKKKV